MSNLQEKIKKFLLLSDEDADLLAAGDFKSLLVQNKEAVVRVGILYAGVLAAVLIYLSLFSVFGAFGRLILLSLFFGTAALVVFTHRDEFLSLLKYPLFSYFFAGIFALVALSAFSDISSQGSFISKLLALLIIGGAAGGIYTLRAKLAEFGISTLQTAVLALVGCSLLLSLQTVGIRFVSDQDFSNAQRRSEARRLRDAEQMRHNHASMKACASEEECRKLNMKKNTYYSQYEEVAQEACEVAVAKEISGRFEWTVSAKDYKFGGYEVDVLKDEITLTGDRAQLIGRNGVKTKIFYSCRYNTRKKTSLASVRTVQP